MRFSTDQIDHSLDEHRPFEPLLLLSSQSEAKAQRSGFYRLRLAILEEALTCLHARPTMNSSHYKRGEGYSPARERLMQEAKEWIKSEDKSYIFSFVNVCEGLDINPEWLRRKLESCL